MNIETYNEVNNRLAEWDPIGVGLPISKDEYKGYIPKIYNAIIQNEDIKNTFFSILLDDLGLPVDTSSSELNTDLDCLIDDLRKIIK